MEIDDIFAEWDDDSRIDPIDLGNEALKISKLHNKYHRFLAVENREQRRLEAKYKQLVNLKSEWYMGTMNGTEELTRLGWEPQRKVTLKADIPRVVEADRDVVRMAEILGEQKEKTFLLTSILKEIMQRSFNVRAAIDFQKFQAGA